MVDREIATRLRGLHGCGGLLGVLALVLAEGLSTALCSPVKDGLAVLVHLQLDNGDLKVR